MYNKLRRKNNHVVVGDMRDRIIIQNRDIQAPEFGTRDFDMLFQDSECIWASIDTFSTQTIFDGVDQDRLLTHKIRIRFDESINAESWILLPDGTRLKIINIENLDSRSKFMLLNCTATGTSEKIASQL